MYNLYLAILLMQIIRIVCGYIQVSMSVIQFHSSTGDRPGFQAIIKAKSNSN